MIIETAHTDRNVSIVSQCLEFIDVHHIETLRRDPEDIKRERKLEADARKARYAPHRKYGFVKNLKK